MPKQIGRRSTTYLVAVMAGSGQDEAGEAVYAVKARRPDEAMQIVRAKAVAGRAIAIVGSLSSRTAKAMRLNDGEMRPV